MSRSSALGALLYLATLSSQSVLAQFAVPPPLEQETADCASPVYASDHLVCGDPELHLLDGRLKTSNHILPAQSSQFLESAGQWFKRRSLCAFEPNHRACLIEAYTDRLDMIAAIASQSEKAQKYRCGAPLSKSASIEWTVADQIILRELGSDVMIGIASPFTRFNNWVPNLRYRQSGNGFAVTNEVNIKFKCQKLK